MSVRASVEAELGEDVSGWREQLALALAGQVDGGSASAAAQLRAVMHAIEDEGATKAGDELDDFRRARDAARAAG